MLKIDGNGLFYNLTKICTDDNKAIYNIYKKSRCVCETLGYAPAATKSKSYFLASKVKVKVTRSLTLVFFERVSFVE